MINGYRGGLIGDLSQNQYIGSAEVIYPNGDISIGGPIDQSYGTQSYGSKYEIDFNWGFNVDDQWFFGVNVGIQGLNYQYDEFLKEFARDPSQFPIEVDGVQANFHNLRYRYSYNASGTGINAKFGVLYAPGNGLRVGAAIQTPTALTIRERWQYAADTHFSSSSLDCNEISPEGRYDYNFRAPYHVNAGVAYTFENIALLSVDYEMCDYSTMRFYSRDGYDDDFTDANNDIRDLAGISHMLRAGVELKPVPEFAIRTGYNLTVLPESYYDDLRVKHTDNYLTHVVSFGLGYSSPGSFFADIAARYAFYPKEYFRPYGDYLFDGNTVKTASPEIENTRSLLNLVLTQHTVRTFVEQQVHYGQVRLKAVFLGKDLEIRLFKSPILQKGIGAFGMDAFTEILPKRSIARHDIVRSQADIGRDADLIQEKPQQSRIQFQQGFELGRQNRRHLITII